MADDLPIEIEDVSKQHHDPSKKEESGNWVRHALTIAARVAADVFFSGFLLFTIRSIFDGSVGHDQWPYAEDTVVYCTLVYFTARTIPSALLRKEISALLSAALVLSSL
ncbi:hypothetical protein HDU76_006682 [Blyttiomyces sp. JEL0837]|nr:hypothetical protein HDU76_006682 [Blyttiomyces sp. JEL0837]